MGINNLIKKIPNLHYRAITKSIWQTILVEGLDEEYNAKKMRNWVYVVLPISKKDKIGLKKWKDDVIEKFNYFDYLLKEKYNMKYIDLIDYSKGIVRIVRLRR